MPEPPAALITGCSSGIGQHLVRCLDGMGWHIAATARDSKVAATACGPLSQRVGWFDLDVTSDDSRRRAVTQIKAWLTDRGLSGLKGLVNNAGIVVAGPLEHIDLDELRQQFEVNVVGLLGVTQACLPLLRREKGRIVNIGSISGRVAAPLLGPYAMSKFALEALSDSLRVELHEAGIFVSLLEPGPISTPLWRKSLGTRDRWLKDASPEALAYYGRMLERVGREVDRSAAGADAPEKVSRAVVHALTARRPRSRYPVGRGVGMMIRLLNIIPDRIRDAAIRRRLC
ncbi:MAG: SDR family oxidoreductase [Phycisphaeraceae bacterium]|nr:SDR family oxidoreductase [Phycisphaeraceae bacterium]